MGAKRSTTDTPSAVQYEKEQFFDTLLGEGKLFYEFVLKNQRPGKFVGNVFQIFGTWALLSLWAHKVLVSGATSRFSQELSSL